MQNTNRQEGTKRKQAQHFVKQKKKLKEMKEKEDGGLQILRIKKQERKPKRRTPAKFQAE